MRRKLERLERQRAVEHERARIAHDIHDDLGATLTRITMLSDPARIEAEGPPQAAANLNRIYDTARELTRSMDEIVWAVNPQHDTLDSLVAYLEKFALDLLNTAGIRCRLDVPLQMPAWPLTAEVRHDVFLSYKEALHNVLKHAGASEVRVAFALEPAAFTLTIADNGRGFLAEATAGTGNGLDNMRRRLEEIGGRCAIRSAPGQGTCVTFNVSVKARRG
jgi:signal transduction histidine kinase